MNKKYIKFAILFLILFNLLAIKLFGQDSYAPYISIMLKPNMFNLYQTGTGRYVFSNGGCLEVEAYASGDKNVKDISWKMDGIDAFFYRTIPSDKKGQSIIFKFMDLPDKNSSFGNKTLSIYDAKGNVLDSVNIKLFFPIDGAVKVHKGILVPNWFYYWGQLVGIDDLYYGGSYVEGMPRETGSPAPPEAVFAITDWYKMKINIFQEVVTVKSIVGQKPDPGIDTFAQAVYHERRHVFQFLMWDTNGDGFPEDEYYYKNNREKDKDGDWLPDVWEPSQGYDPTKYDTVPNDPYPNDCELDASKAEVQWTNNSHNEFDWSYPGKQWPKEENFGW